MSGEYRGTTATEDLSDMVVKAAKQSSGTNKISSISLAQLHLSNMKLHGREEDIQLLKNKLLELKDTKPQSVKRLDSFCSVDDENRNNMILIKGVSGVGKSSLVMKGLRDPATKMGIKFACGKFDLNNTALPLSAFAYAMAALSKIVLTGNDREKIRHDLSETFNEEDRILLTGALPGCDVCNNSLPGKEDTSRRTSLGMGKEAISRLQYAIRKLLKVICTHHKGVCLFIDDLQWSDMATLDLLQSIALDSEIPSLLIVGAFREDEVSE